MARRSADFQSAVSQNSILRGVESHYDKPDFDPLQVENPRIQISFYCAKTDPSRLTVCKPADCKSAIQQLEKLYSLSGVVHRLNRSFQWRSALQPVNNAVGAAKLFSASMKKAPHYIFGFGSGTNMKTARLDEHSASFDRSRNPNADTHPQVPTPNVSLYTVCAPCSPTD